MSKNIRDSNLFAIDFDAIESVLAEANGPLINKANNAIEEASKFPDIINTKAEAESIKDFLKNIRALQKEVSRSRLDDGRPFTQAGKVVKEWFEKTECKLKAVNIQLSPLLSQFTQETLETAERMREKNEEQDSESVLTGSTSRTHEEIPKRLEPIPEAPNVKLEWEVISFDRENLPLEALRQYLTDYAIMNAIKHHLSVYGPNALAGVKYERRLAKDF